MKKGLKITGIIIGSILLLLLIIEWVGSPIAKKVVENHSEAWIGRKVEIGSLHVNPFVGSVRIRDMHCTDADLEGEFVKFDELYVQASLIRLLGHNIYLRHIHLKDFDINLWSNDTCFNFSDLPQRFASSDTIAEAEQDTTPSSWRISLNDIRLQGGEIAYSDRKRDNKWKIEHVNLNIPGLYFGDKRSDAGLSLDFPNNGGNLRLKGAYNMSSNDYAVSADFTEINLNTIEPVLKDMMNIASFEAWLNGHLAASGNIDDIMGVKIRGDLSLRDLSLTDDDNDPVIGLQHLTVQIDEITPSTMALHFDTIALDSIFFNFERAKDYNTLSRLLKEAEDADSDEVTDQPAEEDAAQPTSADATATASARPDLSVKHFALRKTSVRYTDRTLFSPFEYNISGITARADNLTLDGDNHLMLNGHLPNGGSLMANWRGGMDFDKDNVRIVAMLKNVHLQDLSPWIEYMFAHKVEDGTLSLASDNSIRKGKIDATEKLDIYNLTLSGKNDKLDAELKSVPLKLGVELLTDLNGKISMTVPITGDMNSPKFSLGKLIAQTIGNILLKATAAPFAAIATATNQKEAGDLTQLSIDLLQPDFSLEQYRKLDLIAEMMQQHEDLSLCLYQEFNLQKAIEERAVFNLKRSYYESQNEPIAGGQLTLIDIEKIRAVKTNSAFNAYIEPMVGKGGSLEKRAVAYYGADTLQTQVCQHAERRNRFVIRYLNEQQGVEKTRIEAQTAPIDSLKIYKGNSRYQIR